MGTVSLDTRRAHLVRQHRDITAVYTWVNDERALILLATYRKKSPWFVIPEPAAYRYDDPRYLAKQSALAAQILGMDESTTTWSRIASIIHEGLPDLIRMPGAPDAEFYANPIGTIELRANGELVGGQEVRIEKSGGMEFMQ